MPEWRNGRRKGLKIPRPFGREGSTPSSGTKSYIMEISIKFNKDYRGVFKEGQEVKIPIEKGITYLVGKNGSGKSTLLRAIRATQDDFHKMNIDIHDGMVSSRITYVKQDIESNILEVNLGDFKQVFVIDAEADDPTSFENSATAYGGVAGGGLAKMRMSRGQSTIVLFNKFIKDVEDRFQKFFDDALAVDIRDEELAKMLESWKPLVIIDEIDEGLDLRVQAHFNQILSNKFCTLGARVLVVSHNPVCMLSQGNVKAFDVEKCQLVSPSEYIKELAGAEISITYPNEPVL